MDDGQARAPRNAALDGVRGLAILLVVMHNAGSIDGARSGLALKLWAMVSNAGWVGVQLFFALSGYLITSILLESKGAPRYFRNFYARRVLRIVPLYFVVLAIILFVVPHIPPLAAVLSGGTRSTFWYWAYLSNWVAPFGGMVPALPHVWSLAVEEQFYLFWPLLVAATGERAIARMCVLLILAAVGIRWLLHAVLAPDSVAAQSAYEFTVTRWDAIAAGALIATGVRHARSAVLLRRWTAPALASGFAALFLAIALQRGLPSLGAIAENVNMPLSALVSALVVSACVVGLPGMDRSAAAAFRRALTSRWLVWVGKYSYAIYIFHLPVHLFLHPRAEHLLLTGSPAWRFLTLVVYTTLVFAVSAVLALVSWYLLEQPMLSLKRFFPMRHPVPARTEAR